ncbi:hypothetical protein B296_00025489, partial [Ensete ventricosum]
APVPSAPCYPASAPPSSPLIFPRRPRLRVSSVLRSFSSLSRATSALRNRNMDWNLRGVALVFLIALVAASAGSPVCPRPSAGDSILGRPDSCWDLDPTAVLRGYQIGVVEGDEAVLQKALSIVQKNREEYVALLFYASWCPFSKICRPNFQILSNLFPTIHHFAFEESVIRPRYRTKFVQMT